MGWSAKISADLDIRDGATHEIYITNHEVFYTKKKKPVNIFLGRHRLKGPVKFVATDHLASKLLPEKPLKEGEAYQPILSRIAWHGKVAINDNKTFNVFSVEVYEFDPGERLPAWIDSMDVESIPESESEPLPDAT